MDVILLEKIHKLGELGEQVSVKAGFGRNFLIPTGKAVPATAENVEKFEARRAELEKAQADAFGAAQARANDFNEFSVTIVRKSSSEGKLFGSVTNADVAEEVSNAGKELKKNEVQMPEGPIRQVGSYEINLHLHTDVNATITVVVEGEEAAE